MKILFLIVLVNVVLLSACSTTKPVRTSKTNIPNIKVVQTGRVLTTKNIMMMGRRSSVGGRVGTTTGRIAGGVLGSGYGSVLGSVIGGVLGGVVGSNMDNYTRKYPALEILVRLDDGQQLTVTQPVSKTRFKPGDKVKLAMKQGEVVVMLLH